MIEGVRFSSNLEEMVSHFALQGLRRITLTTLDAHGLYERYGFTPLANPDVYMELWNPKVYKDA